MKNVYVTNRPINTHYARVFYTGFNGEKLSLYGGAWPNPAQARVSTMTLRRVLKQMRVMGLAPTPKRAGRKSRTVTP